MPKYKKQVQFPQPFIPGTLEVGIKDPFGATIRSPGTGGLQQVSGGGGGGAFPDLAVVNGITGAVIDAGTETLSAGGKNIVWVQIRMNVNGTAGYMLVLGSLGYPTSL